MSALVRIAVWAAIVGIRLWLCGGVLLRVGGAASLTVGLPLAADTGSASAALIAVLGTLAWHWLFALRNHHYRSPLARRVLLVAMRRRLDPTQGWGLPTIPPGC